MPEIKLKGVRYETFVHSLTFCCCWLRRGSGDSNVQVIPDPVEQPEVALSVCSDITDDNGELRRDFLCNEDGSVNENDYIAIHSDHVWFVCIDTEGKRYGAGYGPVDKFERICSGEIYRGEGMQGVGIFFELPERTIPADNFEVCPSPDELTKFVDTFEPANTFDVAPVLSFADSSTEYHKQLVRESVSFLNKALPDEYDITESGIDVEGSDGGALSVPGGEIYIQFFPERAGVPVGLAVGRYIRIVGGAEHEIGNSSALRKSYVLFIAHEIMHVLGLSGHVDLPTNSIMMEGDDIIRRFVRDRNWPREEILSAVDVWGIRYFYEDATRDPEEWLAGRCN